MEQPNEEAIRDSIAAVFEAFRFDRSVRQTLWDRLMEWLGALLAPIGRAVADSQDLRELMLGVLVALGVAILLRIALVAAARRGRSEIAAGVRGRRRPGARGDPWIAAREHAAAGQFTDAAHALYMALLGSIAQRERLRLDPAKTVGDYVRELRARSSSLLTRFRDFARSYETIVYGMTECDREHYNELHALAIEITGHNG
ncbi:MAG: DUF4129 domain-containing protein [Gemmatimonadaceae bacterium]